MRDLFSSTAAAWSARPTDPNDVFLAQLVSTKDTPARVGLFGIPFDGAVLGRPGAREGPDAIRAQMAKLKPWSLSKGPPRSRSEGDAASGRGGGGIDVRDWGNVRVPMDVKAAHEATESAALAILEAGQIPLALGGDHSLTFPLVKAAVQRGADASADASGAHEGRRQKVGVINLDAHLDVRDFSGTPNSGTSFGRLLDLGLVPGKNLVEVGIRDFANAEAYAKKVHKAGGTILGANEWAREGLSVIEHAIEVASDGVDGVYLSVDIDVLDQAHAPGVSAPTPGGVDSRTLLAAIAHICDRAPLIGCDIMETAPPLDRDSMTARAAAWAAMTMLGRL